MTTSDHQSVEEFDTLLLSTVHTGDVTSLKTHLSSLLDPNVYLNRVYDEPHQQKCTLLMIACLNGHEDIVCMLLDCFKPALEVLNVVRIQDDDRSNIYQDVTVLWVAAAINHFLIVKRLVEQGARINHTNNTNSTPLRCTCYSGNVVMARYLIENGADIRIAKRNNDSNLILSVYRKHLKMTTYLVDELGCDVNECGNDGYSPLYRAVECGSLEMVEFLLNRGARNFPATADNRISPLMLAAEKRRKDLVDAISIYCSTLEWIEAEELLGSAFACGEHGDCDLDLSFEHFCRALELRSMHNLQKFLTQSTIEVFSNRQECQTVDQMKELRLNSDDMHIEALLVRERLLGPSSLKYHCSLRYRGAVLADNKQYQQAIALWLYEFELHRQHSIYIDAEDLCQFVAIFSEMVYESVSVPIEAFLTILTVTIEEVKRNKDSTEYNLHTLLFLITIASQPTVDILFSITDRRTFYQLLHFANQDHYITRKDRSSLLHLSLSDRTSAANSSINYTFIYPCLQTVRTLLKCGADVDAFDANQNTPLHILASNSAYCDENILQLLFDAGAHLDCVNTSRETPIDIASNLYTKQLLQAKMKINLKCLCARLIQKDGIQYHGMISSSLQRFIEKH